MKKTILLFAIIFSLFSCSKDDEPTPVTYQEENFLSSFLTQSKYNENTTEFTGADRASGIEFTLHKEIAKELEIDYFFAKPYHSWERGENENLNGLVRQYFPKDYDFNKISESDIKYVENKLNNRPRKRFGFLTPNQVNL
jgi:IS30 family transposase